jgi:hypothetical protein
MRWIVEIDTDNPAAGDTLVDLVDRNIDELGAQPEGGYADVTIVLRKYGDRHAQRWFRAGSDIGRRAEEVIDLCERLAGHV